MAAQFIWGMGAKSVHTLTGRKAEKNASNIYMLMLSPYSGSRNLLRRDTGFVHNFQIAIARYAVDSRNMNRMSPRRYTTIARIAVQRWR